MKIECSNRWCATSFIRFMEILQPSQQRSGDIPPPLLSLPVFIPPDWGRTAWLFPSIGVDRVLCVPCQLWLVGSTGGGEALTGSDRSMKGPGPVHHLSAHAQWVPGSPFNAVCNTRQLPAPNVCVQVFVTSVFFSLHLHPWIIFLWKIWLLHLTFYVRGR